MALKIWLGNGLVDESEAKVSVFDHSLLYGDGVFEGIRVYSGKVFELKAHLERLYESASVIRQVIPMTMDQMTDAIQTTVKANAVTDGYIRLIVTRGIGDLGLNPLICKGGMVIIIASNIQLYPEEFYEKGMKVVSAATIRNHPMALPPQIKSLNYLNNILAKIESIDAGAGEAIMYNHLGYVAEASGDNIFLVKNGVVFTPPIQSGSLDGITRRVVIRLAKQEAIPVIEQDITRFDLYTADEVFLTGSAAEVIGIIDIDGRKIGGGAPGAMTKRLRSLFFKAAHS